MSELALTEFVTRLRALADLDLRLAHARAVFQTLSPATIAQYFAVTQGDRTLLDVQLVMSVATCGGPDDTLRRAVALAATETGLEPLVPMFQDAVAPDDAATEHGRAPKSPDGRVLTLGERKALARRVDRRRLERALRDPSPDVVAIALGNPALTEFDVVRLAAKRPTLAATQRLIFSHTRWVVRAQVQSALVMNPHTPQDVALHLLPQLSKQERRRVVSAQDLSRTLRLAGHASLQPPLRH